MRVDTTVVETNVHHPTDSTLLGDGVRVLIRTMKKITQIAGAVGTKLRDRSRSVKFRLLEIGRVARAKGSIDLRLNPGHIGQSQFRNACTQLGVVAVAGIQQRHFSRKADLTHIACCIEAHS
jgi:hypothetical protein